MSKKIWRGRVGSDWYVYAQAYGTYADCTVVPDAACFPVKEAMAYISAIQDGWAMPESATLEDLDRSAKSVDKLQDKYLRAVERMKKKAGKK